METLEKIINFFEGLECSIQYVLNKKDYKKLLQYAVIYNGENIQTNEEKFIKYMEFKEEIKKEIEIFQLEDKVAYIEVGGIQRLLKELKRDDYEIIYEKSKEELKAQK